MSYLRFIRAGAITAIALLAPACSEPVSTRLAVAPDPVGEVRLVVSEAAPAAGATIDVVAEVALPESEVAGSFTARIRYDTTALQFEGEIAMADGTLRATNAAAGVVRFAGAAQHGVSQGRLAAFRFRALRADAARSLQLTVDELHTVARANAISALRVAPTRMAP